MAFAATVSEAAVIDPMGSGCGVGAGGTEDGCDGTGSLLVEEMIVLKLAAPQPERTELAATAAKPWSIWRREKRATEGCELIESSLKLRNYTGS